MRLTKSRWGGVLGLLVIAGIGVPAVAQQAPSLLAAGDSLRAAGEFGEARRAYQDALRADPDLVEAYLHLGTLELEEEAWGAAADRFDDVLKRDPKNVAAHYYRGIVHREQGRFRPPMMKELLEWRHAEEHFEGVIAEDSSFRDVLYQLALLEQYRGHYIRAIALGKAQRRLRPELVAPQVGLFRFYRLFVVLKGKDARTWLQTQTDDYGTFFQAERLRRQGELAQAETLLVKLLQQPRAMPRVPVHLTLARINSERGRARGAEAHFWEAVASIRQPLDGALVFEDVKYILSDEELEAYRHLDTPEDTQVFFHALWAQRNPLPAAEENVRLAEHYRRLVYVEKNYEYYGFRTWFNDPDPYMRLDFAETYRLNHEFNDKGLIYLRHGPPDDRVATLGEQVVANESWRYQATECLPAMTFHFVTKAGAAWRLVPVLMGPQIVFDRVDWGHPYSEAFLAYQGGSELEIMSISMQMLKQSQEIVDLALNTDRHTWADTLEPLDMPALVAAFRGDDGKTRVEVFYAVPMAAVVDKLAQPAENVEVEVGLAVHDLAWSEQERQLDVKTVTLSQEATDGIVGGFRFSVPPDSYHVALHVRPLTTSLLGAWQFDQRFPDFTRPQLALSDVLLAAQVGPSRDGSLFEHGGGQIFPQPTGRFAQDRPVHLYFEVYNLTLDDQGQAHYLVEYTLTPAKGKRRNLFNLFGLLGGDGKGPALSLRSEHSGMETASKEYAEIDAGSVASGAYTLDVTITDQQTGASSIRSRDLVLY